MVDARETILIWHDLPMSVRREIASEFGVPAAGITPRAVWTAQIIDAAEQRGELEKLKAMIVAASANS